MFEPFTLIMIVLGALAGGFVNGLAGFGTSLFALGFWLQVLPPRQAVAMSLAVSVLTGLQGLWEVRQQIPQQRARLARFLIPAIFGIPLGIYSLRFADPAILKMLIGVFMILYGAFFLTRRSLPKFERPAHGWDISIGLAGGYLGGLAGLSGALPAMWLALRPWARHTTRAVLQPFNVLVLGLSAILLALDGGYDRAALGSLAMAAPVSLIGAYAGLRTFRVMADTTFRWTLIALMFASGLGVLISQFT